MKLSTGLIILGVLGAIGTGIYFLTKKKSSLGSPEESGLGVGGRPRMGRPKTTEERLATHARRYPGETLPPRGEGLRRQGII